MAYILRLCLEGSIALDKTVYWAFFLTILAGLSTGIGSGIAFICRHTNRKFLSVSLGFSAGVMIYVSMIEIFLRHRSHWFLKWGCAGEVGRQ